MSHLLSNNAKEIIAENQEVIYHLSKTKYPSLDYYLTGSLYHTLLDVLKFIKSVNVIIYKHKYVFYLDNNHLTHGVRKKICGTATSSRHINLLCAIGLINKQFQNAEDMLDINKNFLNQNKDKKRPVNVFYFRRYTDEELRRCEDRAKLLRAAGVTSGNMSFNILCVNGLKEIAYEVYPMNDRSAPSKKEEEFEMMLEVMKFLIDMQGYATRQQIKDNMLLPDKEIDKLFRIYRSRLKTIYTYGRPTADQMEEWKLEDKKYIYH